MNAYLAEPSEITTAGRIRGTSLRCYEVKLNKKPYQYNNTGFVYVPESTGWMYVFKNNKFVRQQTTASLKNKYVSSYHQEIAATLDKHSSYSSSFFASPELAILAKLNTIQKDYYARQYEIEQLTERLDKAKPYLEIFSKLANQYPELIL